MIKPDNITFPLEDIAGSADPKIVLIIKDIQDDEPYVGSVSIFKSIFMEGKTGTSYKMWITLFDDQGDDEYDGAMGLNDDEDPRILMEFTVTQVPEAPVVEPTPFRKSIPE